MPDSPKPMTPAELQIQRLQALRSQGVKSSQAEAVKAFEPHRTVVEKTVERLEAMRQQNDRPPVGSPARHAGFPKFEGKYKSVKLTLAQMRALEQLFGADPGLYPGRILRLALNQWLGLPNIVEDEELEKSAKETLERLKKNS